MNFLTLNVNSFFGNVGRTATFLEKVKDFDIVFLQEVHGSDPDKFKNFVRDELGNIFIMHLALDRIALDEGRRPWNGVAILIKQHLRPKITLKKIDSSGRYICLDVKISQSSFRLFNVYAPAQNREKAAFVEKITKFLSSTKPIIFAGDTNTYLKEEDTPNGRPLRADESRESIRLGRILDSAMLVDAFMLKKPDGKSYTHVQIIDGIPLYTRIDHIFVSKTVKQNITEMKCSTVAGTDHRAVIMELNIKGLTSPKRTTIIGEDLVQDRAFCDEIRSYFDTVRGGKQIPSCQIRRFEHYVRSGFGLNRVFACSCPTHCEIVPIFDQSWWLDTKSGFKKIAKVYKTKIRQERINEITNLYTRIHLLEDYLTRNPTISDLIQNKINQVKSTIVQIHKKRAESKTNTAYNIEVKNADLPTSTFFTIKSEKREENFIEYLTDEDGIKHETTEGICKLTHQFYQKLYSKRNIDQNKMRQLSKYCSKITKSQADAIEEHITLKEYEATVESFLPGKSPGPDGLTPLFYKTFYKDIGVEYCKMMNYCIFEKPYLYPEFLEGLITILPKNEEKDNLKNYRPISLLNLDLKIFTKLFARRLYEISSTFLSPEQLANPPGKGDYNSLLIKDAIILAEDQDIELYILDLDFRKAFDMISHEFLWEVLEKSGLPPIFITFVRNLYNGAKSSIKVNGYRTAMIDIENGVRQGCSLSVLLFFMCVQPLINMIKDSSSIEGLQINGRPDQTKISQYSDNTTLLLRNKQSIKNSVNLIKNYEQASGSILSLEKSYGIPCGRAATNTALLDNIRYAGLRWTYHRKILGVCHSNAPTNSCKLNTQQAINEFCAFYQKYKYHATSMFGAAILVNVVGYAKFWHRVRIYPLASKCYDPIEQRDRETIKVIQHYTLKLIWDTCRGSTNPRLPITTLFRKIEDGGIGLINFKAKADSLRIKPIIDFLQDSNYSENPELYPHLSSKYYMLGLPLREYLKISRLRPHKEKIVRAYVKDLELAKVTLKALHEVDGDFDFKAKAIYAVFNKEVKSRLDLTVAPRFLPPRINKQIFEAFKMLKPKILQPNIKNIFYDCIHNKPATNPDLPFIYTPYCTFGKPCLKRIVDTPTHFFLECKEIEALKNFLQKQLRNRCNHTSCLDVLALRFCLSDPASHNQHLFTVLLGIYRNTVSLVRHTRAKSREKRKYRNEDQIKYFKKYLNNYIRIEYQITTKAIFKDRYLRNDSYITIEDKEALVIWDLPD